MKNANAGVIGMMYIVSVRMIKKSTGEKIKNRLLLIGCEKDDIERKLRWIYDASEYAEFSVTAYEKVTDKIHVLSSTITQEKSVVEPIIDRDGRSEVVGQSHGATLAENVAIFAFGLTATVLAKDEPHAMRRVAAMLQNKSADLEGKPTGATRFNDDAKIVIEQIGRPSGLAIARDVSTEINRAHFVRG